MKNVKVGHMGMLVWRESDERATWRYCIADNVFDDRIEFLVDGAANYVHVLNSEEDENSIIENQKPDSALVMLYKNGEPSVSKKTIFGKYTFDPKK